MNNLTCNKCGNTLPMDEQGNMNIMDCNLRHQMEVRFKYGSPFDLLVGKFCLCEDCLLAFMDTFVIKVPFVSVNAFNER